jgi:hypothetical protein
LDYIIDGASIVVIACSSCFRTRAEIVRIACAVVIGIGECAGASAIALNYIIDGASIVVIACSSCFRTRAEIVRIACAVVVGIGEGS